MLVTTWILAAGGALPRPSAHRSQPRFLPQGNEGDDELTAEGDYNSLSVCPASALPAALDLVCFRRAAKATTR